MYNLGFGFIKISSLFFSPFYVDSLQKSDPSKPFSKSKSLIYDMHGCSGEVEIRELFYGSPTRSWASSCTGINEPAIVSLAHPS